MILRFCSGSVTPASRSRNRSDRIDEVERQSHLLREALDDLVRLVVPQQAVVDEDARQAIADRAVNEHRGDSGIDAARETADDLADADLRPDPLGRFFDERRDRPVADAAADAVREVAQDREAVIGVRHFGMKQQRIELALRRLHRRNRRRRARRRDGEPWRHGRDVVAMARPHAQLGGHLRRRASAAMPLPVTRTFAWPNSR